MSVAVSAPSVNLGVIGMNVSPMNASNGMMCYSPMSKPALMDNMSPALKPGMAPVAPPPMDMGVMSEDKMMTSKRWEGQVTHKETDHNAPFASSLQMKNELFYSDAHDNNDHQSPMMRASDPGVMPAHLDLDIQDFLTEDCSINAGMGEMKSQFEDRLCGNSMNASVMPMHSKHAMVSRDLLKWDVKGEDTHGGQVAGLLGQDDAGSFEDELLLDLASVEPGAWEVPLSPLNEEEDMMPWLDLCF
jgi:hypothetical protein